MKGNYIDAIPSGLYVTIIFKAVTVRTWNVLFTSLCEAIEIHGVIHSCYSINKSNRHEISHKSTKSHSPFITRIKGPEEHAIKPSG